MTLLHESVETKKLDVRVVEKNVSRGVISSKEVDDTLKKLPDDADNADWIAIDSLKGDDESGSNGH